MENKFIVKNPGEVELTHQGKTEILKKSKVSGWVVEKKLRNMMELISNNNTVLKFETLTQLELERPAWAGVILSLFEQNKASCH